MINLEIVNFVKQSIKRFPNYYHICRRTPNHMQKWQQELLNKLPSVISEKTSSCQGIRKKSKNNFMTL